MKARVCQLFEVLNTTLPTLVCRVKAALVKKLGCYYPDFLRFSSQVRYVWVIDQV